MNNKFLLFMNKIIKIPENSNNMTELCWKNILLRLLCMVLENRAKKKSWANGPPFRVN